MLLKRASWFFLSLLTQKHIFCFLRKYKLQLKTYILLEYITSIRYYDAHRRKVVVQRDVVSLLVQVSIFAFQTSKYLKEAQIVYKQIHRGTLCFRNVTISYTVV